MFDRSDRGHTGRRNDRTPSPQSAYRISRDPWRRNDWTPSPQSTYRVSPRTLGEGTTGHPPLNLPTGYPGTLREGTTEHSPLNLSTGCPGTPTMMERYQIIIFIGGDEWSRPRNSFTVSEIRSQSNRHLHSLWVGYSTPEFFILLKILCVWFVDSVLSTRQILLLIINTKNLSY